MELKDPDVNLILQTQYAVRKEFIGPYSEPDARRYWAEQNWTHTTFDQYLQRRNGAFTYNQLRTLRRLGIRFTPSVIITDRDGNLIWFGEMWSDADDLYELLVESLGR